MNQSARLFYHLQQKEEELLKKARQLDASEHEFALKKNEQDSMMRILKERMENTHLLYLTKLENLNNLILLKEEGFKQKLDYVLNKSELKDLLSKDKIERIHDQYQNEKVLNNIDHHRELLHLDQTIAEKMQEIHIMKRDLQQWEHVDKLRDQNMAILKEQNVLESKSRQLAENMFKQQDLYTKWKDDYMESLENLKNREFELKEKAIDLYYRESNQKLNNRESELDMRHMNNESYKDTLKAREERIQAGYENMQADFKLRENELSSLIDQKELKAASNHLKRSKQSFEEHKEMWLDSQKSEKERFNFYKTYSDNAEELKDIKDEADWQTKRLELKKRELLGVNRAKRKLEEQKKFLEIKVNEIKKSLPSGDRSNADE